MFSEELDYFISNQTDLVNRYRGKFLVLKGNAVVGVYDTALDAYLEGQVSNKLGSFMIQPCEPGPGAYTVTIASANAAIFEG